MCILSNTNTMVIVGRSTTILYNKAMQYIYLPLKGINKKIVEKNHNYN